MDMIRIAARCAAGLSVVITTGLAGAAVAGPASSALSLGAMASAMHHETSQIVRVDGVRLLALSRVVAEISAAHPELVVRGYPFISPSGVAANIVVRGRHAAMVEAVANELAGSLGGSGLTSLALLDD